MRRSRKASMNKAGSAYQWAKKQERLEMAKWIKKLTKKH